MKILEVYLIVINLLTFLIFGIDKYKAKHHQWRISEQMLFVLSIVGGSIGAVLGMQLFHHKTKKTVFKYGIPVILVIQIILLLK